MKRPTFYIIYLHCRCFNYETELQNGVDVILYQFHPPRNQTQKNIINKGALLLLIGYNFINFINYNYGLINSFNIHIFK